MRRLGVVTLVTAAFAGCNPPAPLEATPRASFVLLDGGGQAVGRAEVSSDASGRLAERVVFARGLEQRVTLSEREATVVSLAGKTWQQGRLVADGERWRHASRAGLALTETSVERREGDVVGVGAGIGAAGLGASLASWWHEAPRLLASGGAVDARFVDVGSGRALPLRVEPRGALEVEREDKRVRARRFYAWTPASGVGLVTDERGELLAVEGLAAGERAVLEGTRVPLPERPPLPAGVREERFTLADAQGRFDAALTVPSRAEGPVPGVVLLAGSGPGDLDGNLPGLQLDMYRRLAGAFAANGVAVLRYDKPGVAEVKRGAAPEDVDVPDADDLIARANSVLDALAARPEVRGDCLLLVGHSEGGILAPELAAREPEKVRGLVLLASPARDLFATLEDQLVAFLRGSGASDDEIARAKQHQQALFQLLRHGRDVELPQSRASAGSNAWLKSYLDRSPAASLARLDVPVLAVFGAEDLQVLDETEAEPMKRALAHLPEAEVVVVPDMDHLLMPASPLPGPGRYGDPARAHSPFVRDEVPRWIVEHACR